MSDVAQDLASVSQLMSHHSIHTKQSRQHGVKCGGGNPQTLIFQAIFKNYFVKTYPFFKKGGMHRLISTWLWMDHLEIYILPLITVFSSHLEGSILCKAMRSSAGVRGDMWVRPSECVPSNLRMKKDKRLKPNLCNWTQHTH